MFQKDEKQEAQGKALETSDQGNWGEGQTEQWESNASKIDNQEQTLKKLSYSWIKY